MNEEKLDLTLMEQKELPAEYMGEPQDTNAPNFILSSVPQISIKSLHIQTLKAYEDFYMDFRDGESVKPFVCFVGENGAGKSTALNAIQMIFNRYDGYDNHRLLASLSQCVRHVQYQPITVNDNFLVEAEIAYPNGDYTVRLDKTGFLNDHPDEIKLILYRLCYYARFDKELHQFQLIRDKWDTFKMLFESVTGYEIEEMTDLFSASEDPIESEMIEKYVLGFTVKKPYETISHKECSNGERKVIKSFSTLLNLEISPRIVLIDDIAMHVALSKHMALIDAMQNCYPNSQIFSTTHSYRMTKNLKRRSQIYDLRIMHSNSIIKNEPWRLRVIDEIDDALFKLEGLGVLKNLSLYDAGKKIRDASSRHINDLHQFQIDVSNFLKEVSDLYISECVVIRRMTEQITQDN